VGQYGNMEMIQSKEKIDRTVLDLKDLTPKLADQKVWVRARLQTSRSKGKHTVVLHINWLKSMRHV